MYVVFEKLGFRAKCGRGLNYGEIVKSSWKAREELVQSSWRAGGEFKVQSSCHSSEFHIYHYFTLQSFSCQCKDGYGGDGEECGIDPDLDGIPSVGLSCTLPNCYKVRNIFCAKE